MQANSPTYAAIYILPVTLALTLIRLNMRCAAFVCTKCSPDSSDIEHTLACMDQNIGRLTKGAQTEKTRKVIIELIRARNSRLPIARMPPEVLSKVLLHYRDFESPLITHYYLRLFVIIQVSSYWRNMALSDPRLWDTIDLRLPFVIKYFRKYFKSVPLHIALSSLRDFPWDILPEERVLDTMRQLDNPIATLELHGSQRELARCVKTLLGSICGLRSLKIYSRYGTADKSDSISELWHTSVPDLQILVFSGVEIDLKCNMLRSCAGTLREVSFEDCDFLADYIALPMSMPHLIKFTFKDRGLNSSVMAKSPVFAPSLAELNVSAAPQPSLEILAQLQPLPHCRLSISVTIRDTMRYTSLQEELEELVAYISSSPSSRVVVKFGRTFVSVQCEVAGRAHHKLDIDVKGDSNVSTDNLLRATSRLFVANPETLSIVVEPYMVYADRESVTKASPSELMVLCDPLTSVRMLEIGGPGLTADVLARALFQHQTFLPNLARLVMRDVDFTTMSPVAAQWFWDGAKARFPALTQIIARSCVGQLPHYKD